MQKKVWTLFILNVFVIIPNLTNSAVRLNKAMQRIIMFNNLQQSRCTFFHVFYSILNKEKYCCMLLHCGLDCCMLLHCGLCFLPFTNQCVPGKAFVMLTANDHWKLASQEHLTFAYTRTFIYFLWEFRILKLNKASSTSAVVNFSSEYKGNVHVPWH